MRVTDMFETCHRRVMFESSYRRFTGVLQSWKRQDTIVLQTLYRRVTGVLRILRQDPVPQVRVSPLQQARVISTRDRRVMVAK